MWLGKGAIQSHSPLRAGRERGVSPRESGENLSFWSAEGGSQAVFWAFNGRHREPRKRPGPDVIGHQLTVLRAPAPPAAAAVAVADVAAAAVPPPAAGFGTAATTLNLPHPDRALPLGRARNPKSAKPGLEPAAGNVFPHVPHPPPPIVSREKLGVRGTLRTSPPVLGIGVANALAKSRLYNCGFLL